MRFFLSLKLQITTSISGAFFMIWSRRNFLKFMGAASALSSIPGCSQLRKEKTPPVKGLKLSTASDNVDLAEGLSSEILIKEGQRFGKSLYFGTNNDYLNLYPFSDGRFGLWTNHESLSPLLLHGRNIKFMLTKRLLKRERQQLGGSFVEVTEDSNGNWKIVKDSDLSFRVTGNTKIPLSHKILGKNTALGTLANCAGGYTPWGTLLTCEENFHHFYGDVKYSKSGKRSLKKASFDFGWTEVDPQPPENYGWVVEVDPRTKSAEKLIPLGRFSHECATVALSKEGFPVVYSGDDKKNECLYKFISSQKDSLKEGTLYVADFDKKKWISLDINSDYRLKDKFKDQTSLLIRAREAAKLVGGTPLDRPEDIEIDPISGDVFVTLTNNKPKGNYHGSIIKISEYDKGGLKFRHKTFRAGGSESGFSCPDNMVFDQNGNLWMTSDISGGSIGKKRYKAFGHNGLFVIPRRGRQAGEVIKVASAPVEAEFTGPFFSPDQKTLFLSVQHPGEKTKELGRYTSNWPFAKKNKKPRSAVITIKGALLERFTQKT